MIDPKTLSGIYLAAPLSDPDKKIVTWRRNQARRARVELMLAGAVVYAPTAYPPESRLPNEWGFWRRQSLEMLTRMDSLVILTLDGWRESVGVTDEDREWRDVPFIQEPPGRFPRPYYICPETFIITEQPLPARMVA